MSSPTRYLFGHGDPLGAALLDRPQPRKRAGDTPAYDELVQFAAARGWHVELAAYPQSCTCGAGALERNRAELIELGADPDALTRVEHGPLCRPLLVLELHVEPGRLLWIKVQPLVGIDVAARAMLNTLRGPVRLRS